MPFPKDALGGGEESLRGGAGLRPSLRLSHILPGISGNLESRHLPASDAPTACAQGTRFTEKSKALVDLAPLQEGGIPEWLILPALA